MLCCDFRISKVDLVDRAPLGATFLEIPAGHELTGFEPDPETGEAQCVLVNFRGQRIHVIT